MVGRRIGHDHDRDYWISGQFHVPGGFTTPQNPRDFLQSIAGGTLHR